MVNLGDVIRTQRKKLQLKVYELAGEIGIHPAYLTQIEKNSRTPSPEVLKKIEKALAIELKDTYIHLKFPADFFSEKRRLGLSSEKRPRHSPPMPPPTVIKEFPTPEARRLALFIHRNVESSTRIIDRKGYETLLKDIAPEKVTDRKLFEQVLDIMKDLKKEKDAYWHKFIKQSKGIVALIDPKPPKPFFKPAGPAEIANRPKPANDVGSAQSAAPNPKLY